MFIELTEFLRCPAAHPSDPHLVLVPDQMVGRMVLEGTVGCPQCRQEFPVRGGVADFDANAAPASPAPPADQRLADTVRALLALTNPGGYVVLVGSAAALAPALTSLMGGIHLVGVNPPAGVQVGANLSLLRHGAGLPLRSRMARGVVLGAEATAAWLEEGARVLLGGLRLVVLRPEVTPPGAVQQMASGHGLWVGEKRP
ncbi:MAG TPA: hypothetical protein VD793_01375 [Gemmatimonadales bacterium]|nr:hypothetical protein [Gemmatimonadales bacterium]